MKYKWLWLLAVVVILFILRPDSNTPQTQAWEADVGSTAFRDIAIAIGASGVQGCGDFHYKETAFGSGEYIVACSRDGKAWRYFNVWPVIEKAVEIDGNGIEPPY